MSRETHTIRPAVDPMMDIAQQGSNGSVWEAHAKSLAFRLLRPTILDETLRSGVFVARPLDSAVWSVWTATLIRESQGLGALVMSMDLLETEHPAQDLLAALIREIDRLRATIGMVESCNVGTAPTLASLIRQLICLHGSDLVLVLEGVDCELAAGNEHLLYSLKAARDECNLCSNSNGFGFFLLVGVGRDQARTRRQVRDSRLPFFCATLVDLPASAAGSQHAEGEQVRCSEPHEGPSSPEVRGV